MPLRMDGTSGQTMDQLGLGGTFDTNTMDYLDTKDGGDIQRVPKKGILILD